MTIYICNMYNKEFKQKGHYNSHLNRKIQCKSKVIQIIPNDSKFNQNLKLVNPDILKNFNDNNNVKYQNFLDNKQFFIVDKNFVLKAM